MLGFTGPLIGCLYITRAGVPTIARCHPSRYCPSTGGGGSGWGLYQVDEEVADLLQDDDHAYGGAVVQAVGPEQADDAQRPVQVGWQLRERSPVTAGLWLCNEGGQSRAGARPQLPLPG